MGKYLDLARELKKLWKHDSSTSCSWCTWNGPQWLGKETGRTGGQRKNQNHTDHSTVKIS